MILMKIRFIGFYWNTRSSNSDSTIIPVCVRFDSLFFNLKLNKQKQENG